MINTVSQNISVDKLKLWRGTADGINKEDRDSSVLTWSLSIPSPFIGHSELHADMWGPAQVDMCLCVCVLVGSEGKQQSGRVAMRPSGNWMSRSTFLAERVWKVAVRGACFCPQAPGHLNRKWLLFHHKAPVYGERSYIRFHFLTHRIEKWSVIFLNLCFFKFPTEWHLWRRHVHDWSQAVVFQWNRQ